MTILDVEALLSSDWRHRMQAVEELAGIEDQALAGSLLELVHLKHSDLGALNAALQLLCQMSIPVSPGLIQLLEDPDPEARLYAALALGELGDPGSIPALIAALEDPSTNVRFNAIEALGKLRAGPAVGPLVSILKEREFFLAFPAIEALAKIGDSSPAPILRDLLSDRLLGPAAVQALGDLGEIEETAPLIAAWFEGPDGQAEAAALAIRALGRRAGLNDIDSTHPLLSLDGEEETNRIPSKGMPKDRGQRQAILQSVVGPMGPQGQARLLAAAEQALAHGENPSDGDDIPMGGEPADPGAIHQDREKDLVGALAEVLGWLVEGDPSKVSPLEELYGLLHLPAARLIAARALAQIGEPAVPGLCARLEHTDPEVRLACVHILSIIASPAAIPALTAILDSEDENLAIGAAHALGKTGDLAAYDPLIQQLRNPSAGVRRAAANALHALRTPQHLPRLLALLQEPDATLRAAVLHCLALETSLEDTGGLLDLIWDCIQDPSPKVRKAAVEALAHVKSPMAGQALAQTIHSPDPSLRAAAAHGLSLWEAGFAVPLLEPALEDPDPWTRLYACRSLGKFARPESISSLSRLVHDPLPPVRIALAEALIRINSEEARKILYILAADPETDVSLAARAGLSGQED